MNNKDLKFKKDFEHIFQCANCHKEVNLTESGTKHRNHCPYCLWSKHVDEKIGDRRSRCHGAMRPVGLSQKKDGELMIVHECTKCLKVSTNRIAGDDLPEKLIDIFDHSDLIKITGANLVPVIDRIEVFTQLFGKDRSSKT